MDSNLLSALIGILGGLVGVAVGALLQHRSSHGQMCRQTTLELYDRFDDADILESRIRADGILAVNAASENPKCFSELYASLSRDEWQHISRTRHFLDQIGLLNSIGYLDRAIAIPLFSSYVNYWVDRYFADLEKREAQYIAKHAVRGHVWRISSAELKKHFEKGIMTAKSSTTSGLQTNRD